MPFRDFEVAMAKVYGNKPPASELQKAARKRNWKAYCLASLASKIQYAIKDPVAVDLILGIMSDYMEKQGMNALKYNRKERDKGTEDATFHGKTILANRYRLEFRPLEERMGRQDFLD